MQQLVLVQKQRPEWQAGKCNGVGGKIEEGETDHQAMVREFREETGKEVPEWTRFCTLVCPNATVYFFYAIAEDYNKVESVTDEEILLWDMDYVMESTHPKPLPDWLNRLAGFVPMGDELHFERPEMIPNIRWLVQMARSFSMGEGAKEFVVTEIHEDAPVETAAKDKA